MHRLISIVALLPGCLSPPPYAIITVEDELGLAGSAVAIEFGTDLDDMQRIHLEPGTTFPVTFAAEVEKRQTVDLWVDAIDTDGARLARGHAPGVVFARKSAETAAVSLLPACETAEEETRCLREDGTIGYCLNRVCSGPLWTRSYGESPTEDAAALAVAVDSRDNVIVAGTTGLTSNGVTWNAGRGWVGKLDSRGDLQAVVDGLGTESGGLVWVSGVAVDSDDNIIVVGTSGHDEALDAAGVGRIWKYDSELSRLVWDITWDEPGPGTEWAVSVATRGNEIVVGGLIHGKGVFAGSTNPSAVGRIQTYAANGEPIWSDPIDVDQQPFRAIDVDSQGRIIAVGDVYMSGDDQDVWIRAYGRAGDLVWSADYDGTAHGPDMASAVSVASDDSIFVIGTDDVFPEIGGDVFLLKLSPSGDVVWRQNHGGMGEESGEGVATDIHGNVVVIGSRFGKSSQDIWIRKYDASGDVLWTQTHDGVGLGTDNGTAVALDSAGNVIAAGAVTGGVGMHIWIGKYGP